MISRVTELISPVTGSVVVLSDQLALKLNTLNDLEENLNHFVQASIQSSPLGPRLVTSRRCGIDVLTCEVRFLKMKPLCGKGSLYCPNMSVLKRNNHVPSNAPSILFL